MPQAKKILVAEDDPASRELLVDILGDLGYEVVEAHNGEEAWRKIQETVPDLVLLDIQMPLLDGYGVVSRVRQDPRFATLPVLALTAYAMKEDRERTLAAGFDCHVPKPINIPALRTQIVHYLAKLSP